MRKIKRILLIFLFCLYLTSCAETPADMELFDPVTATDQIQDEVLSAQQTDTVPTMHITQTTSEATTEVTTEATTQPTEETTAPTEPEPQTEPIANDPEPESENMVWIPTKGGKKYHAKATCSGMKGPEEVTKDEAISRGFTPCKKCYQ